MAKKLFGEFSPVSDSEWLEKIRKDLKGRAAEDISKYKPFECIQLKVFYSQTDFGTAGDLELPRELKISSDGDYTRHLIADPLNHLVRHGSWLKNKDSDLKSFAESYHSQDGRKRMGVNGAIYQAAGSSAVFELALILAHLNEYFHVLKESEILRRNALSDTCIRLGIGQDYFMEIAKLRALRILVANLARNYDVDDLLPFTIFAENSTMCFSSGDMDGNILRSTTACMSAIIGGCNYLLTRPHNAAVKENDAFGERIAKNIQLILKHEAHLDKTVDASAGSYFVESLTRQVAENSWMRFRELEKAGGFIKNFLEGTIQAEVRKAADERVGRMKDGKDVLVGVNKYRREKPDAIAKRAVNPGGKDCEALQPLFLEDSI